MKELSKRVLALTLMVVLSALTCVGQETGDEYKKNLYNVEFRVMPQFMNAYFSDNAEPDEYIDLMPLARIFKDDDADIARIIESITAESFETKKGDHMVVYTFPEPKEIPQAKYGAIYIPQKTNKKPRYLTLEKTFDWDGKNLWVLGESTEESHSNYGVCKECKSPKEFYKCVMNIINKK